MQDRKGTWRIACAAMVVGVCFAGAASAQQFRLIAGGGENDGGPALQANLAGAFDVVYDSAGNLYVSQKEGNRIRKITPSGTISTLVGGTTGFAGDGGPASAAKINQPAGLEIDAAGNLYFADSGNRRVRKISTTGIITTIAGNGQKAFAGDGGAAKSASFLSVNGLAIDASGNVFVSDTEDHRIRKIAANGVISTFAGDGYNGNEGDGGPATSARFYYPLGLDVDAAGNLWIADSFAVNLRKVTPAGIISAFPGYVTDPENVAISPSGDIYVATKCNLSRLDPATGYFVRIAGGIAYNSCGKVIEGVNAQSTPIGSPHGLAFDAQGRAVFVDTDADMVRRISDQTSNAVLQTIAGVGGNFANGRPAMGAPLGALQSILKDQAGNLLIADAGYRRVRRISPRGMIDTLGGTGFGGACPDRKASCAASAYGFGLPWGIALGDVAGQVLVSDPYNYRIVAIESNGTLSLYAGEGTGPSINDDWGPQRDVHISPYGLLRRTNEPMLIASANTLSRLDEGMIYMFAGDGRDSSLGDGGPAYAASTFGVRAVAVDAAGTIYLSEKWSRRVRKIGTDGIIWRFAGNGTPTNSGDGGAAYNAGVGEVTAIATYASDVYLAAADGALRRVDAKGIITTVAFPARATGLFVDGSTLYVATQEGRVYVATLATSPRKAEHDYDGDARADILWRNIANGSNTIWKSANGATPQTVTGITNLAWKAQGQGDFDGDGKDDIFWRNTQTGANTVWRSANGATAMTATGITDLGWSVAGVGDFDKDGKSDLVWRHKGNGKNAIWRTLTGAAYAVAPVGDQNWKIVGVGDFDGDFVADLFWRNGVTGANQVWRGGNNVGQLAVPNAPPAWKLQAVGDFDGDGRSDVFLRNASTGQNAVWSGAQIGRTLNSVTDLQWKVVAAGDYNGDGKDDVLWRNGKTGANTIWKSGNGATQQAVTGVTNAAWTVVPYTNQP